jgi:hypothetical protein
LKGGKSLSNSPEQVVAAADVTLPDAHPLAPEGLAPLLELEVADHARSSRLSLAEFVTYFNRDRPHRSLGLQSLTQNPTALGTVVRRPVLGGLQHTYAQAA